MKKPHFDVLLHSEELGRPQTVQEQNREKTGKTSTERIISESGENKQPSSVSKRTIEWIIVMSVIVILFLLWIL